MRYSPESLTAFVETVETGSFSAAAKRLGKSQSAVSMAVAHLEADIGIQLFDRSTRRPSLTDEGCRVLGYVQSILAAAEQLDGLAAALSGHTEARLTLILSDILHPDIVKNLLAFFEKEFPHTEIECLLGEKEDTVDLILQERADLGLCEARAFYPGDIVSVRLPFAVGMGIYAAPGHPLTRINTIGRADLASVRQLQLKTYTDEYAGEFVNGPAWSAPDYLMLLSMAAEGFGWCILPCALVEEFSGSKTLTLLPVPGWPRQVAVDLIWNKKNPPQQAGSRVIAYLQTVCK